MPDNYKRELQNCIVGNRIIDEPIQSNDIKENNILLVRHFDDKFPITEEQLQTMKCFNCQNSIKCNEQLVFNIDKLKQWHKHIYKNPYATSIQHLLTSDFSTLLNEYPCHKQLNAICHLTISLILAEISDTFLTDKTSTIAYTFLTDTN